MGLRKLLLLHGYNYRLLSLFFPSSEVKGALCRRFGVFVV